MIEDGHDIGVIQARRCENFVTKAILRPLKGGGQGSVYLVEDLSGGEGQFALKHVANPRPNQEDLPAVSEYPWRRCHAVLGSALDFTDARPFTQLRATPRGVAWPPDAAREMVLSAVARPLAADRSRRAEDQDQIGTIARRPELHPSHPL